VKGTDAAAVPTRILKMEGENLNSTSFFAWQRGDNAGSTCPMPDSMHMQRVSFGLFDGAALLIAFYVPVSKTET